MPEFETLVNPPQEVFELIVKLSGETEGWPFQLGDYKFWSTSYDKFWLVTVVEKGTTNLVASVSLARWDGDDGPLYSIGLFYCVQKYRGQGLAKPIFQKVMDMIGENDNATLTGAVKMSAKYATEHGFDKYPEHWHLFSSLKMEDVVIPGEVSKKFSTKHWSEVDYDALTAYDRTICIRDRKKIMTAWFNLSDTFTRVVLDDTGKIVGYGTIRIVSQNKLSSAPFYADCLEAAVVLLADLLNNIPNWQKYSSFGFLYPECNQDPLALLGKFSKSTDLISTAPFVRSQFTKHLIPTPDNKVYSLSDCAHQFV
ncbi:DUF1248 domain-containing protein [Caenorhabditis elegans]|uniref:DUF1248 domain-containing protein n=1 Tax=Caenorhabditis elegans TaxID=6239 RepID=O01460_CAEEL|nr:DUF1248 domain-containing protein [Caenorhabditis elegans]CCD62701.1 DUF1248 domain-containing protein [Caenorhabditis elegans]|eukprot:NP_504888.2 Uncharacterized protein CELE_C03G6.17 [Caenorhabditis elegans]